MHCKNISRVMKRRNANKELAFCFFYMAQHSRHHESVREIGLRCILLPGYLCYLCYLSPPSWGEETCPTHPFIVIINFQCDLETSMDSRRVQNFILYYSCHQEELG